MIYTNSVAFAAKKLDGSVVTFGLPSKDGESSSVNLTSVDVIYSNNEAFAAKKLDGTVVTWGQANEVGTPPRWPISCLPWM